MTAPAPDPQRIQVHKIDGRWSSYCPCCDWRGINQPFPGIPGPFDWQVMVRVAHRHANTMHRPELWDPRVRAIMEARHA